MKYTPKVTISDILLDFDGKHDDYTGDRFISDWLLDGIDCMDIPYIHNRECIGLPYNFSELIEQHGKGIVANGKAIYHLFYGNRLVYIGMSTKVRDRLIGHSRRGYIPFEYVLIFHMPNHTVEQILDCEERMIIDRAPPLNKEHLNTWQ